jgi:hypothetical protein
MSGEWYGLTAIPGRLRLLWSTATRLWRCLGRSKAVTSLQSYLRLSVRMFSRQQSSAKQQQEKHNYAKLEESYKLMQVDAESARGQTLASVLMMEGEKVQVHRARANGRN